MLQELLYLGCRVTSSSVVVIYSSSAIIKQNATIYIYHISVYYYIIIQYNNKTYIKPSKEQNTQSILLIDPHASKQCQQQASSSMDVHLFFIFYFESSQTWSFMYNSSHTQSLYIMCIKYNILFFFLISSTTRLLRLRRLYIFLHNS